MPVPGDTLNRLLTLDAVPDAVPVVRVFRNGVRFTTVVPGAAQLWDDPVTGPGVRYPITYQIPGDWLGSDFLQLIAYPLYGDVPRAGEEFGDRLGADLAAGDTITSALILGEAPTDSLGAPATPTVAFNREGVVNPAAVVSVTPGAVDTEFIVAVTMPDDAGSGFREAVATALFSGVPVSADLWASEFGGAAPPPPETGEPVTAHWAWSEPVDRNDGIAAALVAVRNTADAGEESDVRISALGANTTATLLTDLRTLTLAGYVAADSATAPALTLAVGTGLTVIDFRTLEIAFNLSPNFGRGSNPLVSVYAEGTGLRRLLLQGLIAVTGTAKNPP